MWSFSVQPLAWDDFRLVRAIAEYRSLNGAADSMGVNNSTVFRRLNALEEQLGVRIFERARSGYILTPAGEEMVTLASQMADSIVEFERRIAGQDVRPAGELRVTTTDTIFSHLVAPMFCAFSRKYPDIRLDFAIENRTLNLSKRDADVAIRASVDPPETLVGRRIGNLCWGTYASKQYLRENNLSPNSPAAFFNTPARWIGFSDPLGNTSLAKWMAANIRPEMIGVRVSAVSALVASIQAGLGIGLIPCFIGMACEQLVRIPDIHPVANYGLWVLTHPDLKKAARVRAFLDFFGTELAKKRDLLEGTASIKPVAAPSAAALPSR
jgi:DNA-binding transcriptional LysR family regulator